MSSNHPGHDILVTAVELALRAPSIHNSQPWLWRIGDDTVQLYADPGRRLPRTDPDMREMIVSCGAALHHLRVAAAALGWATVVHRLPNPAVADHLAAVEFRSSPPTPDMVRLSRAITQRCTDRRRYTSWEVPAAQVEALVTSAGEHGVLVRDVTGDADRVRLVRELRQSAAEHDADADYRAELSQWSGHHAAPDGVPARSAVATTDPAARRFVNPGLAQAVVRDIAEADHMLVLYTAGDDRISWLRAGEATSAVLLTATAHGLATCPITEPLEVAAVRDELRTDILGDSGFPQMIIRTGWAATSSEALDPTPRRPFDDVVTRL